MTREIVLDTETTGFSPKDGDRLIEIGCIEIQDLLPTGRTFRRLVNPQRLIDPGAIRVHGITDADVKDAPLFAEIVPDFLAFIGDAPLIAHNADFDRGFVNHELGLCKQAEIPVARWIDTLKMAQKQFPGMKNSLDALCSRYKISTVERTLHGALIDARLLAEVYLELKGGKERKLDLGAKQADDDRLGSLTGAGGQRSRTRSLPLRSTQTEQDRHRAFLQATLKDVSLWQGYGLSFDSPKVATDQA